MVLLDKCKKKKKNAYQVFCYYVYSTDSFE